MVKTLKKVFSTFVTLTTITWSVGVGAIALPSAASAATLSAGDLIKASGPAVYYYAADGKRYVFPNEKTYFSWFNDFSSVKTISDAELAAISIGANVTIRPGTKLVKITTDPKTYAVSACGTLHWIQSEAIAQALYGNAWASRVVDVPDGFFVNYTIGSAVSSNVHPDGQLIQYSGDSSWYVVWNGVKRKFASDAAFAANGLNTSNAVMTTISYGNGSDVAGREAALADVVCTSAVSPVTGGLTVALASDTPAGMTVPKNAASVPMIKVNLTAGSSAVNVTGLSFHRVGVGSVSDFSNVYLYDGMGKRLSTGRTINSSTNLVQFNSLNVTVPANSTWSAMIYGDFSAPGSTGGQHSFEVMDAASVVVNGNATISGAFPVRGNVFTVGTASSARVDVQKGANPGNPTIGQKDVEISNFKVTANTNDVSLRQVTLYQAGSITNSDLTNLNLYQGSTKVASAASVGSDGHIVLAFSTPYVIANGTTKVFSLRADVGGRAGRTIRTYVEYTTDVTAIDQVYQAGASICIASTATGGCTATSQGSFDGTGSNYIEVTTQGGTLSVAFNGPATQNIAKGQLAVPLYKFSLSSADNDLEIRNIRVSIDKTSGSGCYVKGSAGTNYFRSIKIKDMDTGVTVMGPTEFASSLANSSTGSGTITFTESWNLMVGKTRNLALVADLSNSDDSGTGAEFYAGTCVYKATFQAFQSNDIRVVSTGEFLDLTKIVPNSTTIGNPMTVKASSLTVSLASTPVSGTVVKKQQNVPVAGLTLTASNQSDIGIGSITLAGQSDKATAGCTGFGNAACNKADFSQRVTSLALFDGATQVGQAKAPDTTTGKAQITNMNLVIPKGTTKNLTIVASFSSTASSTSPYDKVAVGIAAVADMQVQDQDSNTVSPSLDAAVTNQAIGSSPSVQQTIVPSGTVTIQADAHPVSNIVVAGKDAWVPFAQYKATAQYEDVSIDRIAVLASSTAGVSADNADFSAIAIAMGGAVKGQDILPSGTTGTKDVDLSTNPIVVPKGGSVNFQLWAKLSTIQASSSVSGATTGVARSGNGPSLGLNSSLQSGEWDTNYNAKLNVRATGVASGERLYAATGAAHGNRMILRKSLPVVTKQSLSSTTLANIDQDLIKFQVAADSAGSISLKQVMFSLSKSTGVSLSNFRLRRGATDLDTGLYSVTYASTTNLDVQSGTIGTSGNSGYVIVSMKPGNEESISGSGNVYTLHATVSGAASGQNVTLTFYRDASAPIVTGYLTSTTGFGGLASSAAIFHIDTSAAPSGTASATGTFVWSDQSEVPHSAGVPGIDGQGSMDWTNDVYVQDISQSQTVSL